MNYIQAVINDLEHETVATMNSRRIGQIENRIAVDLKTRTRTGVPNNTPKKSHYIRRNSNRSGHLSRHDITRR